VACTRQARRFARFERLNVNFSPFSELACEPPKSSSITPAKAIEIEDIEARIGGWTRHRLSYIVMVSRVVKT
jgi:hypothetical protein